MKRPFFYRKQVRFLSYSILAFVLAFWLTLLVNLFLFLVILLKYREYRIEYIKGDAIMEELTLTDRGYELSEDMGRRLDERKQWAMLLDGTGKMVWSYGKPKEIKESYTLSDIARMSRWYLEDYPVYLRAFEDQVMVIGLPRKTMWKYNLQFPISWINYMKRVWFWVLLFDFVWILVLAVIFTRRWSRSREKARIEWIAGISHDIRTPLSVVLGYADALFSGDLKEEQRQQAVVIRHQSLVMKELVEDLNLTSELEYSMQALRREPVCPAVVLREVAAAFLNDAREGELEVEMDIDRQAEGIWVSADRRLLVRALRNLFQNSLRHSGQKATQIRLSLCRERHFCRILFSDNGIGYSREMLRRLNVKKRQRPTQNIHGLGIVCKIIQAHGGKAVFGNCPGGGGFCEIRLWLARTPKSDRRGKTAAGA